MNSGRRKTTTGPGDETPGLIRFEGVAIGHDRPLVGPLDLTIRRGDFWGVVGPNGAGKTTLALTVMGLLPPRSGTVRFLKPELKFGYVPQRHTLDPDYPLAALDVAVMGRYPRLGLGRGPTAGDRARALEELERLGVDEMARRPFRSLSGGEKQRVLMARALASDPDVLVLDEPTEGIDLSGESDLMAFLRTLHEAQELAILMIEHHMTDVVSLVDQLCLINHHTGLFEAGPMSELFSEQRLSDLFGRPVEIDSCAERTHVHVKEGDHD